MAAGEGRCPPQPWSALDPAAARHERCTQQHCTHTQPWSLLDDQTTMQGLRSPPDRMGPGSTGLYVLARGAAPNQHSVSLCVSTHHLARACRLLVHMGCYGVPSHPNGEAWLCDVCTLLKSPHGVSLSGPPACALCPCVGGVMKPTAEGGWCHLLCATWVPGCFVADGVK